MFAKTSISSTQANEYDDENVEFENESARSWSEVTFSRSRRASVEKILLQSSEPMLRVIYEKIKQYAQTCLSKISVPIIASKTKRPIDTSGSNVSYVYNRLMQEMPK